MLTRRTRNGIFELIKSRGVDSADCRFKVGQSQATIYHLPTNSEFGFADPRGPADTYKVTWDVPDGDSSCMWVDAGHKWTDVLDCIGSWAEEVQYVADTPDLWAELQRVPEIMAVAEAADDSNEPFTPDEQAEISTRIDQVNDVILRDNPELTADQKSTIEQTLDEIKEATTRVGRKDWIMVVNGALLGLIVNDLVPPHVVQAVFNVLITGIGHILGIGGPPPIITT